MKQRPITTLETAAIQAAIEAALAIRPDVTDESLRALLGMVARDTARNLTEALTNEGYISAPKSEKVEKVDPISDLLGELIKPQDIAAGIDIINHLFAASRKN
jgi:hypothetical protein